MISKKKYLEMFTKDTTDRMTPLEKVESLKQYHAWLWRSRKQDLKILRNLKGKIRTRSKHSREWRENWRKKNRKKISLWNKINNRYKKIILLFEEIEHLFKEYDKTKRKK
jgi:hypothetical protein